MPGKQMHMDRLTMFPHLRGGGHIVYGVGPVGVGVGVTLFVCTISCDQWLDSQHISWMYNWDTPKNLLDSGDLGLILKVTAVEKLKIQSAGRDWVSVFSEKTVTSWILYRRKTGAQWLWPDDRWLVTGEKVNVPGVLWQVPVGRRAILTDRFPVSGDQFLVPGSWCPMLSDWWPVTSDCCLMPVTVDCRFWNGTRCAKGLSEYVTLSFILKGHIMTIWHLPVFKRIHD